MIPPSQFSNLMLMPDLNNMNLVYSLKDKTPPPPPPQYEKSFAIYGVSPKHGIPQYAIM